MSTFPRHLKYDSVANILEPICEEMLRKICVSIDQPLTAEYDNVDYTELFLRIEFLMGLRRRSLPVRFPDPEFLESAIPQFITWWKEYHLSAGHDPVPEDLIQSIQQTLGDFLDEACK